MKDYREAHKLVFHFLQGVENKLSAPNRVLLSQFSEFCKFREISQVSLFEPILSIHVA